MNQAIILNGGGAAAPYVDLAARAEAWSRGRGLAATLFDLTAMEIKPCLGCFGCWLKTPGRCIIKGDMDEIVARLAATDMQILITPVSFGGYGFHLKKALDRCIPILLPFFEWINNEMHHPLRYEYGKRRFAVVGVLPEPDIENERIFHQLVRRNAINMHAEPASIVLNGREPGNYLADQLDAGFSAKEN